jgi:hypothetical protein
MAKTFERLFRFMLPARFTRDEGEKIWTALTRTIDDYILAMRESLYAQLPSKAQDDALEKIGTDRALRRGRSETRDHYIARLRGWRFPFGHRVRGSAFGLLDQIRQYWSGGETSDMYSYTMDRNGSRFQIQPDGTTLADYGYSFNWDGLPGVYRFWVVLANIPGVSPGPAIGDPALWDNTVGPVGRGYTIGQYGVTPDDIAAMRDLVLGATAWKPAGTRAEHIVVMFANGVPPNPTWDWDLHANRNPAYRYWSLLR